MLSLWLALKFIEQLISDSLSLDVSKEIKERKKLLHFRSLFFTTTREMYDDDSVTYFSRCLSRL